MVDFVGAACSGLGAAASYGRGDFIGAANCGITAAEQITGKQAPPVVHDTLRTIDGLRYMGTG